MEGLNDFSYHLTKYFSDCLPNQVATSSNAINSYRDTFVQLMKFFKSEYSLPPEKLSYKDFTAERIEAFLRHWETTRRIGISVCQIGPFFLQFVSTNRSGDCFVE